MRRTVPSAVTLTALAVLTVLLAGCGSDEMSPTPMAPVTSSAPSPSVPATSPTTSPAAPPAAPEEATAKQVASVSDDVQEYAVSLEQVFFSEGYPDDLAGARAAAAKLTNLELSRGNTIASYTFDPEASEFQLCIENPSGASATYDTEPMSTIQTTKSGGCPGS